MSTDKDALMAAMHDALTKALLAKIESGEATASDLNVARQFLKDNGIDARPKAGTPFGDLISSLKPIDEEALY